ncbi:MAG: hypothetical protein IJ229_08410 [Clostridia bacterium]|nr:hypothetical protein [Clostridia bacterium]
MKKLDHYFRPDEVHRYLQSLKKAYPDLVSLSSVGKTYEGRDITLVTLSGKGSISDRPALSIDGCIHASEVASTMGVLYTLQKLCASYGEDETVTRLLDRNIIYAIPMINQDGAERFLTTPGRVRGSVEKYYPEQNGIVPEDINGDGEILQMRIPDPAGRWKVSDFDPRVMEERRPNDLTGPFYTVVSEGLLRGDDRVTLRDAPPREGLDPNRQFPFDWSSSVPDELGQNTSGPAPLHDIEVRALHDYVLAHPNIVFAMNYHTYGGLHISPMDFCPRQTPKPEDAMRFASMSTMLHDITGYQVEGIFPPGALDIAHGSYTTWLFWALGIPAYVTELWDFHRQADPERPAGWSMFYTACREQFVRENTTQLAWDDTVNGGKGFVPWTPFDHPQLGKVEIGGWKDKMTKWNPPLPQLPDVMEKTYRTTLASLAMLPHLEMQLISVRRVKPGLYTVDLALMNTGFQPTSGSAQAVQNGYATALEVYITDTERDTLQRIAPLEGFSRRRIVAEVKGKIGSTFVVSVSGERVGFSSFEFVIKETR